MLNGKAIYFKLGIGYWMLAALQSLATKLKQMLGNWIYNLPGIKRKEIIPSKFCSS